MEHETIDIAHEPKTPSQQRDINGEGAPENELTKLVPITALLKMAASKLRKLVFGWAALVLVQGGMVFTLQTKDYVFVTAIFLLVCIRHCRYFCPQATRYSLTDTSRSLSADNLSIANNKQQVALPICFINRLLYWCKLVSAIACAVLSITRLVSHDFGQIEAANMATRDFALNFFYGVELIEGAAFISALIFDTIVAMLLALREALFEWAKKVQSKLKLAKVPKQAEAAIHEPVGFQLQGYSELIPFDQSARQRRQANVSYSPRRRR